MAKLLELASLILPFWQVNNEVPETAGSNDLGGVKFDV
jgi:hypothetical protein